MDILSYIDRTEPGSPTSTGMTPASALHDEDRNSRTLPELKKLGRTVYKEVWDEFYNWEPEYCAEILGTVTMSVLAPRKDMARVARAMMEKFTQDTSRMDVTSHAGRSDVVKAFLTSYDTRGRVKGMSSDVSIPVITIEPQDVLPPHPPYESCPPVSRSVRANTDHEHTLPFLPYADDKKFPARRHLDRFEAFEWEKPFDPDMEMIQIETARRLHVKHQVELQNIDRMGLFEKELVVSNNTGLLWEQNQRDFLHWPGAYWVTTEEDLPTSRAPHPDDLEGRITSILRTFCPSINCLHAVCETHGHTHTNSYIPSGKPTITGESMRLTEGLPCGPACFRLINDVERFRDTLPPSPSKSGHTGSLDTLKTILRISPDMFPCQLAIICLKSCNEVFAQRLQLFPDHLILSSVQQENSAEPMTDVGSEREIVDIGPSREGELPPACAHSGPCTTNQCPCHTGKQHCSLACRCWIKCMRQWEGCNCPNGKCTPNSCTCLMDNRECIPGICISCDAGGGHTGRPCNNTRMQCMASKPLEIKIGKYGLGAFALQNMNANVFLGTYAGQIITNEVADHGLEISRHTSLNYLFASPSSITLFDAMHLGNATRFLNHADRDQDNVEAKTMLVNGEYQIGFFTIRKVKAREELFLDYGEAFWGDKNASDIKE